MDYRLLQMLLVVLLLLATNLPGVNCVTMATAWFAHKIKFNKVRKFKTSKILRLQNSVLLSHSCLLRSMICLISLNKQAQMDTDRHKYENLNLRSPKEGSQLQEGLFLAISKLNSLKTGELTNISFTPVLDISSQYSFRNCVHYWPVKAPCIVRPR